MKWLERFLVSSFLVEILVNVRQRAGNGGNSNHLHVFLEIEGRGGPPFPFNFDTGWLKEEGFASRMRDS